LPKFTHTQHQGNNRPTQHRITLCRNNTHPKHTADHQNQQNHGTHPAVNQVQITQKIIHNNSGIKSQETTENLPEK